MDFQSLMLDREVSKLREEITPPLPLLRFITTDITNTSTKTISGEALRSIPNNTNGVKIKPERISDPIRSRKLSRWFSMRGQKETNFRQMEAYSKNLSDINLMEEGSPKVKMEFFDYVVYESLLHVESKADREKRNNDRLSEEQVIFNRYQIPLEEMKSPRMSRVVSGASLSGMDRCGRDDDNRSEISDGKVNPPAIFYNPSVSFDAEFESGNLERATRVVGREGFMGDSCTGDSLPADCDEASEVDQEYDLVLRNDINTEGNIQWYYFAVNVESQARGLVINFPLRIRFNITNMQKKDSLYNYGMKPAVMEEKADGSSDWTYGGFDICYYKNGQTAIKAGGKGKKKTSLRSLYTLTFTYNFERPGRYYFAYSFPYTYTDLQSYLDRLDRQELPFLHRRCLCETLAGNRCDVLTLTERADGIAESKNKPAIVISARVHPGETNSSFMIQGFLDFLCSDSPEALKLRRTFIFTIIPMLNPDGVVHGNYRCSLAGTDLNRRYADAHPSLHPTIAAFKGLLKTILVNRPIALFLDLHGHSKAKNAFVYGCDLTLQSEKVAKYLQANIPVEEINQYRIFSRIYPKILCSVSKSTNGGYFSFRDCSFRVDKSKSGTGRVVTWKDFGILASYTIEASFCGNGNNEETKLLKRFDTNLRRNMAIERMQSDRLVAAAAAAAAALAAPSEESSSSSALGAEDTIAGFASAFQASSLSSSSSFVRPPSIDTSNLTAQNLSASTTGNNSSTVGNHVNPTASTSSSSGPAVENDLAVRQLLDSYRSAVHYQKHDLLTMGKHIAQAIYHFANLTHADLDYELEQLNRQDKESRDRERRMVMSKDLIRANLEATMPPLSRLLTERLRMSGDGSGKYTFQDKGQRIPYGVSTGTIERDGKASHVSLNVMKSSVEGYLEIAMRSDSRNSSSAGMYDQQEENGFDCQSSAERGSGSARSSFQQPLCLPGIAGNDPPDSAFASTPFDLQQSDASEDEDDEDNNEVLPKDFLNGLQPDQRNSLNEMLATWQKNKVDALESTMLSRSLLRPSIFNVAALQHCIQQYSNELLIPEKSTMNVGLRVKCELGIRKALRLEERLNFEIDRRDFEEADGSDDGSDSNPSVDNKNAAKLLKNMSKYKGTSGMMEALRMNLIKRRRKEAEAQKKQEIKLAKRLAKQLLLAKQAEAERLAQLAREKASQQQQQRPSTAGQTRSAPKPLPRYAPSYRLDSKAVNVPVQIKLMNFKDFEKGSSNKTDTQPSYRKASFYMTPPTTAPSISPTNRGPGNPYGSLLSLVAGAMQSTPTTASNSSGGGSSAVGGTNGYSGRRRPGSAQPLSRSTHVSHGGGSGSGGENSSATADLGSSTGNSSNSNGLSHYERRAVYSMPLFLDQTSQQQTPSSETPPLISPAPTSSSHSMRASSTPQRIPMVLAPSSTVSGLPLTVPPIAGASPSHAHSRSAASRRGFL